jgi:hypothetical protein
MAVKTVQFLAVVFTALALVPGGAHLFELPNKIGLDQNAYFTVQAIYSGWALFGIALFGALGLNLALAVLTRDEGTPFVLACLAFLCVAATLAIFFTWTFPTNQATENWTVRPENWDALRTQWEYSHAVNAVVTFVGFCAVTLSALTYHRDRGGSRPTHSNAEGGRRL